MQLKMLITGLIRPRVWRRGRIKLKWNAEMRERKDEKNKRCKWWFWGAFLIGQFFCARAPLFWYSDTHKSQWPKTMTDLPESLTAAFAFLNLCLLLTLANGTKGVKDRGKRESKAVCFQARWDASEIEACCYSRATMSLAVFIRPLLDHCSLHHLLRKILKDTQRKIVFLWGCCFKAKCFILG